ncbi:MAG: hypothetical protein H6772_02425 [Pseudomonadales bacterium]|nr:hypothetical protein [Pseudomonadales bacterium]
MESVLVNQPSYGSRRIAIEMDVGKKRVRRCMQLFGIKPYKRKARWRKRRDFQKPIYIHTDQGSEYISQDYTKSVQDFGVTISMSTKSSP